MINEYNVSNEALYIDSYIIINGVIEIKKLLEILEEEHNITLSKEELEKHIDKLEFVDLCDTYIKLTCLSEEEANDLLNLKQIFSRYKIIDNRDEIIYQIQNNVQNLEDICRKYKLNREIELYILSKKHKLTIDKSFLKELLKLNNVSLTEKEINRLYKELDSKHVKIIVDIYNYLNEENYSIEYQHKTLDRCIELFKDEIVLFHLKDFIVVDGKLKQVGLGEGIMDLENLVLKMQKFCPNAYLIFEGVPFDKMKSSLQFIKNIIK